MKLINRTLFYLSLILFSTVGLWAFLFYTQLLNQIKTTIDDGLSNHKIAIIDNLSSNNQIEEENNFLDKSYILKKVNEDYALQIIDTYKDTLIFSSLKNKMYQVRLLTTAFVSSNDQYYEMKVVSHEINKSKLIKKIAFSIVWLFLFLFVSGIIVNKFVLQKTWKPFYKLLDYLKDFRLDKSEQHELPKTTIKEFSLLNESVENLLNSNATIYNSQKQFIENASHELQTPLAIGINKLELLADDSDLSPEQMNKIGQIIESFHRLSGLNKSLLLLSKIENKQFLDQETLSLDSLITRKIKDFSDYTDFKKIKINYNKKQDWVLNINKNLAEILLTNLIKNAIIHNHDNGEIIIKLTSSSLRIENSSSIPELSKDILFKRFNKNYSNKNSTGLGLSIVKAIVDVSNLSIEYYFNNKHIFEIKEK